MLVAWGALLCESMVWTLWGQCQSQAGRTWRTDGTTKRLGKPLLISAWGSAGTFRPVECAYTCVCVCVCVCWLKACSRVVLRCKGRHKCRRGCVLSLSVRLGLVHFSAGPHLCLHPSVPPLSHQGQLLWAPSHSGAVSGWPLRNILGVFLECSVSLYNNQRAVEEVIIMVKHPGHKLSVSQYLRCTQKKKKYRYIAYIILSSGGLDVVSRKSKLFYLQCCQ